MCTSHLPLPPRSPAAASICPTMTPMRVFLTSLVALGLAASCAADNSCEMAYSLLQDCAPAPGASELSEGCCPLIAAFHLRGCQTFYFPKAGAAEVDFQPLVAACAPAFPALAAMVSPLQAIEETVDYLQSDSSFSMNSLPEAAAMGGDVNEMASLQGAAGSDDDDATIDEHLRADLLQGLIQWLDDAEAAEDAEPSSSVATAATASDFDTQGDFIQTITTPDEWTFSREQTLADGEQATGPTVRRTVSVGVMVDAADAAQLGPALQSITDIANEAMEVGRANRSGLVTRRLVSLRVQLLKPWTSQQIDVDGVTTCSCQTPTPLPVDPSLAAAIWHRYQSAQLVVCRFICEHQRALLLAGLAQVVLCMVVAIMMLAAVHAPEEQQFLPSIGSRGAVVFAADPEWTRPLLDDEEQGKFSFESGSTCTPKQHTRD